MIHLRTLIFRNNRNLISRRLNFRKVGTNANKDKGEGFDQYAAHSPLFMGRWGIEEQRSKIFFEHPPVPNRLAKFGILIIFCLSFAGGVKTRIRRIYKSFTKDTERKLMRRILPFNQAMEDVRFTALEQKNFMIMKSLSDSIHPYMWENVRWRYHQEDIYVPEVRSNAKKLWGGSHAFNQSLLNQSKMSHSTYFDKGLFDVREIGYTY